MIAARQFAARLLRRFWAPTETLDGYEQPELVEVIFQKTIAYKPQNDWPEMAGVSSVLDFGGGCGLHYKQARSPTVRWAVVETPRDGSQGFRTTNRQVAVLYFNCRSGKLAGALRRDAFKRSASLF